MGALGEHQVRMSSPARGLPDRVSPSASRQEPAGHPQAARWRYASLAGRLTELAGGGASATLTFACALVLEAQGQGEPVAWISRPESTCFPPDLAESGVDLDALILVRVPDAPAVARAAAILARSGAFGVLVLDLGAEATVPLALQARLLGLARQHAVALLCLTEKRRTAPSLSSLVSLRAETRRCQVGPDRFTCTLTALKDKRDGPGWSYVGEYCAPLGLR